MFECAHSLYADREQCEGFPFIRCTPPTLIGGTCIQSGGPISVLNRNKDGAGGGIHDGSQSRGVHTQGRDLRGVSAGLIVL